MKWAYYKSGIFPFRSQIFFRFKHFVVSFFKIIVYLKNIPGIIDRNDTSHISDSSSIGMFRLDETAENKSYRVCWIRVPNTKTSRRAHQSQRKAPRTLSLYLLVILYYPCFPANLYWQRIDLFGRLIFPSVEQLPQYFHENLKTKQTNELTGIYLMLPDITSSLTGKTKIGTFLRFQIKDKISKKND